MQEKRITVWPQFFKDRQSYVLQWIDPDTGKRKSKAADTNILAVARMKACELEYELNHGLHKEASRMSWEKFRELFEAEYVSGKRPGTRLNYSRVFAAFERLCNPTGLRTVTARTISGFVGTLRRQPGPHGRTVQESTIKTYLDFLHTALAWAAKQKLIPECPDFPTIRPPKRKPQPVPVESFERLLDKAPNVVMQTFLLSGWLAGLRLNEACSLEWEEAGEAPYIDFARDRIVLPAGFVKAVEDQWVPLDRELREALSVLPKNGPNVFCLPNERKGGDDYRALKPGTARRYVSVMARRAGVKLTFKSLRRGFGCYWASRVPAQVLQKLMRHHHISLTMTYYANVDDAATQAVLGREPSLRNGLRNSEAERVDDADEKCSVNPLDNGNCG